MEGTDAGELMWESWMNGPSWGHVIRENHRMTWDTGQTFWTAVPKKDVEALEYVMNCGVRILATVHGRSMEEIRKKPILGALVRERVFQRYVLLSSQEIGRVEAIFDERGTYLAYPTVTEERGAEQ